MALKRILSACVLIALVTACIFIGREAVWILLIGLAVLALDEIYCNLFQMPRVGYGHVFIQLFNLTIYGYYFFIDKKGFVPVAFIMAAVLINMVLIIHLFSMRSDVFIKFTKKCPLIAGPLVLFPILSIGNIMQFDQWRASLVALLFATFGMDTGAWAFGKKFGQTKLWPAVSPNKTIEGVLGGMLMAGVLGGLFGLFFRENIGFWVVMLFALAGGCSQVGDLIQSKIKRQYGVKDSSNLIPGHGGIYDRLDGLLFLAPFFTMVVRNF